MVSAVHQLLQEGGNLLGSERLNGLALSLHQVLAGPYVFVDVVHPETVGLHLLVVGLQHGLLHLLHLLVVNALTVVGHSLGQQLQGCIGLLRVHGALGLHQRDGVVAQTADATLSTYGVGGRSIFADVLQIDHREHLTGSIDKHLVLSGVGHGHVPCLKGRSLGALHLAIELVLHLALDKAGNFLPASSLLLRGQRGDVLLDERTEGGLVEVTHEVEHELAGIAETLLGYLKDAVLVDTLQRLDSKRSETALVVINGDSHRVAESGLRREVAVLQHHLNLSHDALIGFLVFLHVGEVQVNELHQRLDVLRNSLAAQHLIVVVHAHAHGSLLAIESFLQLGIREVAQSAGLHDSGEQLQVVVVGLAIESVTALGHGLELDLVVLEVGLLQNHTGAVGECQLLIAKFLVLGLLGNFTSLRHSLGSNQRLVLHVVHVGFNLLGAHSINSLGHLLLGGQGITLTVGGEKGHHEVGVVIGDEFLLQCLVNGLEWNHRSHLLHDLVILLD